MTNMRVLQLGRFQDPVQQADAVEVFDTEFLKGLKKMKHLRYFSLRGITRVRELPDEICKRTKLIIADLHGCKYLEKLPEGIGSLKNLTRLDMSGCNFISHMPVGLAKLSKLQVLHGFLIGKNTVLDGQKVCKLEDLANLEYLKKLSINVDVRCEDKTLPAEELKSLSGFKNLVSLSVAWSDIHKKDSEGGRSEENIHKQMTPGDKHMTSDGNKTIKHLHASLAKLELRYLPYFEMPDWVKLLNLEKLTKLYVRGGKLSQVLSHK